MTTEHFASIKNEIINDNLQTLLIWKVGVYILGA